MVQLLSNVIIGVVFTLRVGVGGGFVWLSGGLLQSRDASIGIDGATLGAKSLNTPRFGPFN